MHYTKEPSKTHTCLNNCHSKYEQTTRYSKSDHTRTNREIMPCFQTEDCGKFLTAVLGITVYCTCFILENDTERTSKGDNFETVIDNLR